MRRGDRSGRLFFYRGRAKREKPPIPLNRPSFSLKLKGGNEEGKEPRLGEKKKRAEDKLKPDILSSPQNPCLKII
jgi:hypothetical protein